MNAPDVKKHNPDPEYLRSLIKSAGLGQREAARIIGVPEGSMRKYLRSTRKETDAPYVVQYALEWLAYRKRRKV